MKSNILRLPFKPVIAVIIISIVLFFLVILFIWGIINKSEYFKIREVAVSDGQATVVHDLYSAPINNLWGRLFYLKGRGIFSFDLKKEEIHIAELYPEYSKVKLIRVLPNRLFVEFDKRKALGIVKLSRYYYIDRNMVLFEVFGDEIPVLPLIIGVEKKITKPKTGVKYDIKELELALDIIEEMNADQILSGYVIKTISIANQGGVSCVMSDDVELRFAIDNIKEKIGILSNFISGSKIDLKTIQYIDLRFGEPVIKVRDREKEGLKV